MIEATCSACGTVNRIGEADVPVGAKFVSCASCKSRVILPAQQRAQGGNAATQSIPILASPVKTLEIADLPTPKRGHALAGLEASKPAPKSALDLGELPAPKAKPRVEVPLDLDDLLPADLPAPKASPKAAANGPGSSGISDLPAPKPRPSSTALPPRAVPKPAAISDLPAPKGPAAISDLPAPKRAASPVPTAPAPRGQAPVEVEIIDLPTPKGISDLPMPKPNQGLGKSGSGSTAKGFFDDLPQQATASTKPDSADLPAPKGFFDDLPQPAKAGKAKPESADLPAPKGFFDDLPQPASKQSNAAAAAKSGLDLPAPKGFFDDLPQPAKDQAAKAQPAKAQPAARDQAPVAGGQPAARDLLPPLGNAAKPAPKPAAGFFDDLADPVPAAMGANAAGKSRPASSGGADVFDDLPEPSGGSSELSSSDLLGGLGDGPLDLNPAPHAGLELEPRPGALDLGLPKPGAGATDFGELDLSAPTPLPEPKVMSGITIKATASPSQPATRPKPGGPSEPSPKTELRLDLEEPAGRAGLSTPARRDAAKVKAAATEVSSEGQAKRSKRTKLILGSVLGLALVGSGGGLLYKRWDAQKKKVAAVAEHVTAARAQIHEANPNHWARASTEANAALELDPKSLDAIGLQAEALLGGALDTGLGGEARIAAGRKKLADALEAGVTGPQLESAQALGMIASNQAARAETKLHEMVARDPKNGFWLLYLGWAQQANGDPAGAVKSFDAALAADPKVKLPALYARGKAKLALVDLAGAKADFAAVLELAKDHIGAQVGLAAAQPAASSSQREADLLAILARKDLGTGDPRAVVEAWTLAADGARRDGRLDVARDRYHKALELEKMNVPALVGLARVELRDNKLAVAADLVQKALAQAGEDPDAMITASELYVRQAKLPDAAAILAKLAARQPPLPPQQQAALQLATGNMLEAQGDDDGAIQAWVAGAKLAGDTDLAPLMAAVTKLGTLGKKAAELHDDNKATAYRERAELLLASLADRAREDAALSKALGVAYLGADDPTKAEHFLARSIEMRSDDIETRLELAKALAKLGRTDDALVQLKAAQQIDGTRIDIALELASTLEGAKRNDEAAAAYARLLAATDPPIQARVRAGRFLARHGDIAAAAAQAGPILAAEPDNAGGHYLKGEGLILAGRLDEARKELTLAVDGDPDAQYLDAQGRAAEASATSSGETKFYDPALRAYERAALADPGMFNPQAGTGRIYVARREWTKAIPPLLAANKLNSTDTGVMYDIGIAQRNLGQNTTAAQWLVNATKNHPTPETYWQLALIYTDTSDGRRAEDSLVHATRLAAEAETRTGAKFDWLNDAYYMLGQTEYALHNLPAAKNAYQMFVNRASPGGTKYNEAKHLLNGELR
jgi:predicted Zn-dependent protease